MGHAGRHRAALHLTGKFRLESGWSPFLFPGMTMRRFAPGLLLLLAPCSVAWAEETFDRSQRGACVYSEDTPRQAGPRPAGTTAALPATPGPARVVRPALDSGTGGGGGEDDLMQRMRAPRWHSFLPGMFR